MSRSRAKRRPQTRSVRRRGNRRAPAHAQRAGRASAPRAPQTPEQRRARNRTILAMAVLALLNAYVFVWNEAGVFGGLPTVEAAVSGALRGPLPPLADPPADACGGDPVRIFEGLDHLLAMETSLNRGRTLRLALLDAGAPSEHIDALEAAVRGKVDLGLLAGSGAPLRLATDRKGGVHALEVELAEGRVLQACRRRTGAYQVRNLQHPHRADVEVVALQLGRDADLTAAVQTANEKPELAARVAHTLAAEVDFHTEARPGDRIDVMLEKRYLGRKFHRYGRVFAVAFHGDARRVSYYRFKAPGRTHAFYDASGRPVKRALLRSPVRYFGVGAAARGMLVPSVEVIEGRMGAVYRLPEGAPVVAVGDGVVRKTGESRKAGRYVLLELEGGMMARYCHLARLRGGLELGQQVSQADVLAFAGHSGRTATDRLRLELWTYKGDKERTQDPLVLLGEGQARPPRIGTAVKDTELEQFKIDIRPQQRALQAVRR